MQYKMQPGDIMKLSLALGLVLTIAANPASGSALKTLDPNSTVSVSDVPELSDVVVKEATSTTAKPDAAAEADGGSEVPSPLTSPKEAATDTVRDARGILPSSLISEKILDDEVPDVDVEKSPELPKATEISSLKDAATAAVAEVKESVDVKESPNLPEIPNLPEVTEIPEIPKGLVS